MKKRMYSLVFCLLLLPLLAIPAAARSAYALDYAGLMTRGETAYLDEWAQKFQSSHGLDVVLLTTPELYGHDPQSVADDFYDNNGYAENGILFLLDMGSRQWHISTCGTAIALLSDRDLADIEEHVIPYFSEGRFYDGFCRFLDILPRYLTEDSGSGFSLVLSLGLGAVIAAIAIWILRSSMNAKQPQRGAASYQVADSYRQTVHQDLFLYSNIHKTPRPQNNTARQGGSNIHRSASGRSHGGRGGRF